MSEHNQSAEGGMNTIDLMAMSPAVRRIARILLKRRRLTHADLIAELESLPPDKRIPAEEIEAALAEMIEMRWAYRDETPEGLYYDIQVQKKEGSNVKRAPTEARQTGTKHTMGQLWDVVDKDKDADEQARQRKEGMKQFTDDQKQDKPKKTGLFGGLFGSKD